MAARSLLVLLAAVLAVAVPTSEGVAATRSSGGARIAVMDSVVCRIGSGTTECVRSEGSAAVPSPTTEAMSDVALGQHVRCTLLKSGQIDCEGDNSAGAVGIGTISEESARGKVKGLRDATALAVGQFHACAIRAAGSVVCWGNGRFGQLGNFDGKDRPSPVTVAAVKGAIGISSTHKHTCAVTKNGKVFCWGNNGFGELGHEPGAEEDDGKGTISAVVGLNDATAVHAGDGWSCALRRSGEVVCWGELPPGRPEDQPSHVPQRLKGFRSISELGGTETSLCGLTTSGAVTCLPSIFKPDVITLPRVADAVAIRGDRDFTVCALRRAGTALCLYTGGFVPEYREVTFGGR